MVVDVEQLYKSFGVLADAKDKANEQVESFKMLLGGVNGNTAAKRLSAQFISRFFKHFPDEAENAINALISLCEDEDVAIRKAAVKELPNLCKADKQYVTTLADVLVQLLSSEDNSELSIVNTSLNNMFNVDPKGTLEGVLSQIKNGEEEVRQKAIVYLCKVLKNAGDKLSKEVEVYVLEECKKVMEDVTGCEFALIMQGLSSLQHIQTISGRQQLIDIIADQMNLDKDFNIDDSDDLNRVNQCIGTALNLCSKNVHGSKFLSFICKKFLPKLTAEMENKTEGEGENGASAEQKKSSSNGDLRLDILKKLADLSNFCGNGSAVADCLEIIFEKLKEYMPLPPALEEDGETTTAAKDPELHFSHVECLMFTFHMLGRNNAEFLTSEEAAERLKDFRLRLQYFARGARVYLKEIQSSMNGKSSKGDENDIKAVALRTCNNLNTLIKDLFHNPPSYKSTINVSWKKVSKPKPAPVTASKKRLSDQQSGDYHAAAKKKDDRSLYRAPSGKYSQNISFSQNRNRGGGGGNMRRGGGYRQKQY